MAGRITVSTLNNDTGILATQNGMTGIAKAWANYTKSGSTVTINNSFNVSSITSNGTGDVTIAFTVAMPNIYYSVSASTSTDPTYQGQLAFPYTAGSPPGTYQAPTTGGFRLSTLSPNGTVVDANLTNFQAFSS
jgi:hypothetical protein